MQILLGLIRIASYCPRKDYFSAAYLRRKPLVTQSIAEGARSAADCYSSETFL